MSCPAIETGRRLDALFQSTVPPQDTRMQSTRLPATSHQRESLPPTLVSPRCLSQSGSSGMASSDRARVAHPTKVDHRTDEICGLALRKVALATPNQVHSM